MGILDSLLGGGPSPGPQSPIEGIAPKDPQEQMALIEWLKQILGGGDQPLGVNPPNDLVTVPTQKLGYPSPGFVDTPTPQATPPGPGPDPMTHPEMVGSRNPLLDYSGRTPNVQPGRPQPLPTPAARR